MLMLGHLSVKVNVVLQSKPQRDRGDWGVTILIIHGWDRIIRRDRGIILLLSPSLLELLACWVGIVGVDVHDSWDEDESAKFVAV
jgi:hypothetical protein